jgi:hypothetical protein
MCPGNDESAGKRRSGRTRNGSKWLRATLIEAAKAASRTRDTYLAAQYQRLRIRRGANKATTAIAHSILVAAWHMLQTASSTTTPAPTTTAAATPNAPPGASSPNSKHSDTPSPSSQRSLPERGFLFRRPDTPYAQVQRRSSRA